jgi:hypothetical protein
MFMLFSQSPLGIKEVLSKKDVSKAMPLRRAWRATAPEGNTHQVFSMPARPKDTQLNQ